MDHCASNCRKVVGEREREWNGGEVVGRSARGIRSEKEGGENEWIGEVEGSG